MGAISRPGPENELAGDIQQVFVSTEVAAEAGAARLGRAISVDYQGKNPILVGALKGVLFLYGRLASGDHDSS